MFGWLTKLWNWIFPKPIFSPVDNITEKELRFDNLTHDIIDDYVKTIEDSTHTVYSKINKLPIEDIHFDNFIKPLILLDIELQPYKSMATALVHVHPDKKIRLSLEKAQIAINECDSKHKNNNLFNQRAEHYYKTHYDKDSQSLDAEILSWLETFFAECRFTHKNMTHKQTQEYNTIDNRILALQTRFVDNLDEDNTKLWFTRKELEGMPNSWFENNTTINNQYSIILESYDYEIGITHIHNRSVREKLYKAHHGRCEKENVPILEEFIKLRHKQAKLLGCTSHVERQMQHNMAKRKDKADRLLHDLRRHYEPMMVAELDELKAYAGLDTFRPWDRAYYHLKLYQEKLSFNMAELEDYFPADKVISGMFEIYQQLFKLKIEKVEPSLSWHESVNKYALYDMANEDVPALIGYFYMDLYPRKGKYVGAETMPLTYRNDLSILGGNQITPPCCAMIVNINEEECLSFCDVETLFHEFGHIIHLLCGKNKLFCNHSFATEVDFVEAPATMLEFWCKNETALSMISENIHTGEPLPRSLVEKLIAFENSNIGYKNMFEILRSNFDLQLYSQDIASGDQIDVKSIWRQMYQEHMHLEWDASLCYVSTFHHIINGYDAEFYSYNWSQMIAEDMYYSVFDGNELNPEVGLEYRQTVLEPAATKKGKALVFDFLGRKADMRPFSQEYEQENHDAMSPSFQ